MTKMPILETSRLLIRPFVMEEMYKRIMARVQWITRKHYSATW
jgi:hypothetical protein